jgi:signal transduction histidine kinase
MNEIIDDLLQLSMLEKNSVFNIQKEEIGLSDLILSSVETVKHLAAKKNIDIEQPKDFNCCNLKVDISLIQNALSNILKNAIIYSNPNSKINIILSSQKDSCIVEIVDNGKGIKKENIKKIFKRFFREESSRSRDYGGLGLGLPIVKKILDLHNGDITIDSEIDKGTSVKIFLPIQT